MGFHAFGRAEAHEDAEDFVAILLEHGGSDGGIDAAAHGDDDFLFANPGRHRRDSMRGVIDCPACRTEGA